MIKTIELGKVLNYQQPTNFIVDSDNYSDEYKTPVLTAGKSFILGYTNETHNIYQDYPVIIFDDFTTASKFVDFPFKVKSSAMKILSCDENIADIKFLFYLIQTIKINSEQHQRYWISIFSKIKIPLPPLSVQKEIAEKLDKADALRKKDQELLKQYDELAQAIFIDMFGDPVKNEKGWEIRDFSKLIDYVTKGESPKWQGFDYVQSGIRFITSENVLMGELDNSKSKFIPVEFHNKLKRSKLEDGNLLLNLVGASIGRVCLVDNNILPANINQAVASIKIKKHLLNNVFCLNLFKSNEFQNIIKGNIVEAARANISLGNIKDYEIIYPPLDLQNQFAEKIQNIEAQKEILKKQAQLSEELFQAMLQESFSF